MCEIWIINLALNVSEWHQCYSTVYSLHARMCFGGLAILMIIFNPFKVHTDKQLSLPVAWNTCFVKKYMSHRHVHNEICVMKVTRPFMNSKHDIKQNRESVLVVSYIFPWHFMSNISQTLPVAVIAIHFMILGALQTEICQ